MTVPQDQPAAAADELAALKRSARILANIVASNHQVMEAARIEFRQNGPHAAMQWILNSLPDVWDDPETEWDGKESADEWFDRTEAFYRTQIDGAPPAEARLGDDTSRAPASSHGQPRQRSGAVAVGARTDDRTLGEILHAAREAGGQQRPRPWPPEPWADRDPALRALDEAMAAAVAIADRDRLAAILDAMADGAQQAASGYPDGSAARAELQGRGGAYAEAASVVRSGEAPRGEGGAL